MRVIDLDENLVYRPNCVCVRLLWKEKESPYKPFYLDCRHERAIGTDRKVFAYPYKTIYFDGRWARYIAVRTDAQPLMWIWWWFVVRVDESAKLTNQWLMYLLSIWGLAKISRFDRPTWKTILEQWRSRFNL